MKKIGRIYLSVWVCWAILTVTVQVMAVAGNGPATGVPVLNVGYPKYAFSDVDIKDAQAALEVWTRHLVRSFPVETKVIIYPDEVSLFRALQANEVHLVALSTTAYLKIKDTHGVEPLFVPAYKGRVGEEFCLLVHRQSGITAAQQLRKRTLLYFPRCSPDSPQNLWLDDFLKSQGLPGLDQFFQRFTVTESSSKAILPVFFRQAEACYIPRQFFETMAEMNPQVANELKILVQSPPILRGLLVIRRDVEAKLKEEVRRTVMEMENNAQGKQILTLLRYDRLLPFQPGHLSSTLDCLPRLKTSVANRQNPKNF